MKASRRINEVYAPIHLTLTLETEEEARAMYAVFNAGSLRSLYTLDTIMNVLDLIGHHHGTNDPREFITKDIDHEEWYCDKGCTKGGVE